MSDEREIYEHINIRLTRRMVDALKRIAWEQSQHESVTYLELIRRAIAAQYPQTTKQAKPLRTEVTV